MCFVLYYKVKKEVAELNQMLESVNSELLDVMKCSEEREADIQTIKEQWLEEKQEMSSSIEQLSSSLEREVQEKEQLCREV